MSPVTETTPPEDGLVCAERLLGSTEGWPVAGVVDWLLGEGRLKRTLAEIVEALAEQLVAAGAPLSRLRMTHWTLHPQIIAEAAVWTAGQRVQRSRAEHGIRDRDLYINSPMQFVIERGEPFRRRLHDLDPARDHKVLFEVRDAGATDYLALPMRFVRSDANVFIVATDRPGGFTDADIAKFTALTRFLTPVVEAIAGQSIAVSLMETYLGRRTGRRVLDGLIRRGDGEVIDAALWFSDLRDSTRLAEELPPQAMLELINAYFEHVYQAVSIYGGEVLRFIGDAMLIVFPADGAEKRRRACKLALDAAMDAFSTLAVLNRRRARAGKPEIRFGVGLHVGTVVYGNVGAPERLDFTVMGPAVNRTARLEGLTKIVGIPLLMSKEFAELTGAPATSRGVHEIKGVGASVEVFSYRGYDAAHPPPQAAE